MSGESKNSGPPPTAETRAAQQVPAQTAEPSTTERRARSIQIAVAAAFLIGYALLSHYSNSSPDAKGLGAALSLGPILLIGVALLWRWTRPAIAIAVALAISALLYRYWDVLERNYEWADLAQQVGAFALVAWSFGRTLAAGRVPLCTEWSVKLHGALSPAETRYTRHATLAWTLFYLLLTLSILALYFLAPLKIWSAFTNFGSFALIALMAVADHALRRRLLPPRHGASLLTALRQSLLG